MLFSLGEIVFDTAAAARLGLVLAEAETYSRSVRFLLGALNGGSVGALCISSLGLLVADALEPHQGANVHK
jgi:hypothetical protein